jgi:hypothetical protein
MIDDLVDYRWIDDQWLNNILIDDIYGQWFFMLIDDWCFDWCLMIDELTNSWAIITCYANWWLMINDEWWMIFDVDRW